MLRADAGRDIPARVAGKAGFFEMMQIRVEQRIGTAVGAVLPRVPGQRLAHGGVNVLAGQEVRHSDRKADDIAAGSLELLGFVGNGHDGAGLGAPHALG
jgi:hypothetical protein